MEFAMSSDVAIILFTIGALGMLVAFVRIPHWFCLSLTRHAVWRLRDSVVDDVIGGKLPRDHPAVIDLLQATESVIRNTRDLTMVNFYIWVRTWRQHDAALRNHARRAPACTGLTTEQRALLQQHRALLVKLGSRAILTGTWIGLAMTIRFIGSGIRKSRKVAALAEPQRPRFDAEVATSFRFAAETAATSTWVGRCSSEYLTRDADKRSLVSVA